MNTKMMAAVVVGALVIGGGSFYAGTKYAAGNTPSRPQGQGFTGGRPGGRGGGGGITGGTIISKDAQSITIKLGGPNATSTNGTASGSRIVLYNPSTQIMKFSAGTASDLTIGDMVTISGTTNSDGSVTAQMVQIRPVGMGPRGQ
jgi:hypothetical protein